jgi:hypothetical protein
MHARVAPAGACAKDDWGDHELINNNAACPCSCVRYTRKDHRNSCDMQQRKRRDTVEILMHKYLRRCYSGLVRLKVIDRYSRVLTYRAVMEYMTVHFRRSILDADLYDVLDRKQSRVCTCGRAISDKNKYRHISGCPALIASHLDRFPNLSDCEEALEESIRAVTGKGTALSKSAE